MVPHRTVLIVDDESYMRELLARWLGRLGFTAMEAADNAAALQHLQRERPDLITTDMYRPGGRGIELITQVHAQPALQAVPILLISGSATAAERLAAKQAGATADLPKPFDREDLDALITMIFPKSPADQA